MPKAARALTFVLLLGVLLAPSHPSHAQDEGEFTREGWGAQVGFAPELKQPEYRPGMVIDQGNADEFASILPHAALVMIKRYGMVVETTEYAPYAPSDGYIAATNEHHKQVRLIEIGDSTDKREIEGYGGGMPFPKPENGREIAWNYTLAYAGDDGESTFEVLWVSAKNGVEKSEVWRTISIRRAKFRTDIEPLPDIPSLAKKGIFAATLTTALKPLDKKGLTSLYYGYLEPKDPNGWIYIPAQRRSIRLAFGTKGEAWNNTDLLYEDVRGYTGCPEWMNWKLVKKTTMLLPMHSGVEQGEGNAKLYYDFDHPPHWNPKMKWELRPVYVVEATPKFKGYPYSKMVFTIDAESSHILTKSAYDRKGSLWKLIINAGIGSDDPKRLPGKVGLSLVVDVQSEHATAFFWHSQRSNIGIDPKLFSLTSLRKL